ncbi:hypothetical protein GOODEAATRI_000857, partial [Goodea atripinnis]
GNFNFSSTKLQQHVYESITRIFRKHGAVHLHTPMLLPRNRKLYDGSELACFMDHSGMLVTLPYDLRVVVNLGLVYKVHHHSGVIFQFVAFIKKRKRTVPDIVAAGGRYDHLILEFRGPASTVPVPNAVGASIALEKVCAAMASMEEPLTVSSCDVLVVPVGHSSMSKAISVVQKLWSTGVSADIAYDVLQVSRMT